MENPTPADAVPAGDGRLQVTKEWLKAQFKEMLGPELAAFREEQEKKGAENATSHMAKFFAGMGRASVAAASPDKGAAFTRTIRALAVAKGDTTKAKDWLKKGYGEAGAGAIRMIEEGKETASGLEVKALGSNVFVDGGATVIPDRPNEIIELLRPASVVRSLNPVVVPLDSGVLPIPKITGGATASYAGENQARNASQPSTGDVNLVARELGVIVPLSNRLMNVASIDVDGMVRDDAIQAMATREDLAFLRGDGAQNTPVGIRNWAVAANVVALTAGNTLTSITAGLKVLIQKLKNANSRMIRPGWVWSPTVETRLMTLQDSNGHYVFRDEMAAGTFWGFPFRDTTQMLDSEVFFYDSADVVIGQMGVITIDASGTAAYNDSTGTIVAAYSRNQTVVRLIEFHDIASRHGESIAIGTSVDWS
jgi:HK97 family phage major capsid protein